MRLEDQYMKLKVKHDTLKNENHDLRKNLAEVTTKFNELSRAVGGIRGVEKNNMMQSKTQKQLEAKLEKSFSGYHDALHQNKRLRDTIDELEKEKHTYAKAYDKMAVEIAAQKKELLTHIESTRAIVQARDAMSRELDDLSEQFRKEKDQWQLDMKLMQKNMQSQLRMQDVLMSKQAEVTVATGMHSTAASASASPTGAGAGGRHRSGTERGGKGASDNPTGADEDEKEKLARLKAQTGVKNLDEALELLAQKEDSSASFMTYINELTAELDTHKHRISELERDLEVGLSQNISDSAVGKKILRMEDKLETQENALVVLQQRHEKVLKTFASFKGGVDALCSKSGAYKMASQEELSNLGEISDANIDVYMGYLEKRVLQLLGAEASLKPGAQAHEVVIHPMSRLPKHEDDNPNEVSVHNIRKYLDNMKEDETDSDEDDMYTPSNPSDVLSREEMKAESHKRVRNKEKEMKRLRKLEAEARQAKGGRKRSSVPGDI